ncbi:MAG: 4-alpha-glucanotransferase [Elusimicrobiota bacterium]
MNFNYDFLLKTVSGKKWAKVGNRRRAGVAVPLFSVYSKNSIGIGGIKDIKLLIDWCVKTGQTILQLLPLNDTGSRFTPYDAESSFALDPMYLSFEDMPLGAYTFKKEIDFLRETFPVKDNYVNYKIKDAKINLLRKIFSIQKGEDTGRFRAFVNKNSYWLEDYVLYRLLKDFYPERGWQAWPEMYRDRHKDALDVLRKTYKPRLEFYKWMQWQLHEQMREVKHYANKKGVFIMGDIPFLVAGDSADVWAHQKYFKLDELSGAPPDAYYAQGQRWGMPPYNWEAQEADNYEYYANKLSYAEQFYDMYRIDHVVGLFRVWKVNKYEPYETAGLKGVFDPADEDKWEQHGRKLLNMMVNSTSMLACAEDLGVIPKKCPDVLNDMGIPGLDVQRWMRAWDEDFEYKKPEEYRLCACATVTTHDMINIKAMWDYELGTIDEEYFLLLCNTAGIDFYGIREKIFDLDRSAYGRLRWKDDLSIQKLLNALGRDKAEVLEITSIFETSFHEKIMLWNRLGLKTNFSEHSNKEILMRIMEFTAESAGIFCIQSLLDWAVIEYKDLPDIPKFKVNTPGAVSRFNWSVRLPKPLEYYISMEFNHEILECNKMSNRV